MKKVYKYLFEGIMLVLSLFMLFPFVFAVFNSFKTQVEASKLNFSLPLSLDISNYIIIFDDGRMLKAFGNSIFISVSTVLILVIFGLMASFVISRRTGKTTLIIYILFIGGLIPPAFAITTVKLVNSIGLLGSYSGLILLYCALYMPFTIFLMTGYFKSIPRELDEAAAIDGCGPITMLWKIIIPTAKPVIATSVIFIFMWVWNDFIWPLYMLNSSSKWTIPLTVFSYASKYGTQWNLLFASLIIAALPVIILYLVAQNYIIEGMTSGAVKG